MPAQELEHDDFAKEVAMREICSCGRVHAIHTSGFCKAVDAKHSIILNLVRIGHVPRMIDVQ